MVEITKEMLLEEILRLQARVRELEASMDETLVLARTTGRELEAGQRQINMAKQQHGF